MEAHSEPVEPDERDTTDEWRVAPARSLISVAELEGRIDVALATARSAEEAALEIGAAGLEAAEQARRAAALAERASASAARAAESAREASIRSIRSAAEDVSVGSIVSADGAAGVSAEAGTVESVGDPGVANPSPLDLAVPTSNGRPDPFEDRITAFRLRAEKVMIRLQKIEAGAPPHEATEVLRLSR